MRILFLDDDWERHSHFTMLHLGHDIAHVNCVADARRVLSNSRRFDEAWLDHDLELQYEPVRAWNLRQVYQARRFERYECGLDVARHIAQMPRAIRPRRVFVHSINEGGALRMMDCLKVAGVDVHRIEELHYERAQLVRAA